jgi:hypothetical protein
MGNPVMLGQIATLLQKLQADTFAKGSQKFWLSASFQIGIEASKI